MNSAQVLFDPESYARAYPDVAQSGLAPRDHYERYGRILGRSSAPDGGSASWMQMSPAELDRALSRGPLPTDGSLVHDDLVSIIMPSYNNAEWIARAIHSALSQQSVKVELIIVDDGSTDESASIARRIAADWPNIRVISLLRNFGCYYARNVGVTEAQGAYITIIDSDDIMVSDRILKQLDALKAHPESCACLARTRRWSEDMSVPMGDVRYAENTLLWKRSLVDEIGYYDSVRFGGDTEFRMRIEAVFGKTAVLRIPDEVYFLRTLDTSLTTAAGSLAYINQNGMLQLSLSDDRKRYLENLEAWHKQATQAKNGEGPPRIEFPQLARSFELGSHAQSASPSIGQRRVGAMASFPLRRVSLEATLQSILPQLDILILYLNDYDDVPDFARHPKIRAILSKDALGDLRDNGKFFDLPQDDCSYIFTFDDDLIYPSNYTARLVHQIELLGRSCVVGLHGVIFPYENFTQLGQRTVFHFMHEAPGKFVDLLGTGTTAWHSSLLKPSLRDFSTTGICDLWFAALCARLDIPLYSVPRGYRWVDEFAKYEVSLWLEAAERPKGYFEIYDSVVAPALESGRVRRGAEAQLAWGFSADVLTAAQVDLEEVYLPEYNVWPMPREITRYPAAYGSRPAVPDRPHFHLVLSGCNKRKAIDQTLRSAAEQHPGSFTCDVTLVDDGSTDGSFETLSKASVLPTARLLAVAEQTGTAYGRDLAIRQIREKDTIILSLEFGDVLAPGALRALASHFIAHPEQDMVTCGSERNDEFVSRVLAFRRRLYDMPPEVLQDELGRWLDDGSAEVLTRYLACSCASERAADFDTPVLNEATSSLTNQSPIIQKPVTCAEPKPDLTQASPG